MTALGLIIIAVAWFIQFLQMDHKHKNVNNLFLFIYGLGSLVLVYDGFNSGMIEVAIVNVCIAALAAAVLYKANQ